MYNMNYCSKKSLLLILPLISLGNGFSFTLRSSRQSSMLLRAENQPLSIDVSDLNITLTDMDMPLPPTASLSSSGYQSTSRIPTVHDEGCFYEETPHEIDVTLKIPGLRGQPSAAISVLFSTTTISVSVFGRIVWSCIQKGISKPDESMFFTEDGEGMIPVIQINVKKRDAGLWEGFILQIGEDSLL